MIHLLAQFFRGLHMFVGITEPPPGYNERKFVLIWVSGILSFVAVVVLLFLFIAKSYKF
jgi:hypothetical protein